MAGPGVRDRLSTILDVRTRRPQVIAEAATARRRRRPPAGLLRG